ncbi:MAG: DNA polymerase III subunit beta [Eubacteriales bacterium]
MKFSCDQERLNAALTIVSRSVSQKNSNPALEGIFLEVGDLLQLTGYNMETGVVVTIPGEVEEKGSLVLAAKLFADIIRKLPKETIHISSENYWVQISCGASEFLIMATDPSDYPQLPEVEQNQGIEIQQATLKNMINNTHFAISANETRIIHTGSLFDIRDESLTLVSLDGYRMAVRKENIDQVFGGPEFSFVVPGASLSEIEKICGTEDIITISHSDKHIMFCLENIILITRRIEGEFLDYKNAIPKENTFSIEANRRELVSTIERVSLMISEKAKAPLRCVFFDNKMEISSKTVVGEAKDICPMVGEGKETEMGFNHRFLQDALRHAPSDSERIRMNFSTPNQPCLILPEKEEDDSFCYMVLPVRLKAN